MNRSNPSNVYGNDKKAYVPTIPKHIQQSQGFQKFKAQEMAKMQKYHHESNEHSSEEQQFRDEDEEDYVAKHHEDEQQDDEEENENDQYENDEEDQEEEEEDHHQQYGIVDDDENEDEEQQEEDDDENRYQDEEPIIEEDGESDPEESARHHKKSNKQTPKKQLNYANEYVERKQQDIPKQPVQIEEVIDVKKIKNSKLYQKFLKETGSKPSNENSSLNTSKVTDYGTNKDNSIYESKKGSEKKSAVKFNEQPKDEDDIPYYQRKLLNKQNSQESDSSYIKNKNVIPEKSPIKKSSTQEDKHNNRNPLYERPSDPNNLSNPEIVAGTPVRLSARNSHDEYKNWEQPQLEHGESMINLNLNSSSNYVSVPSQNFGNFNAFGGNMMPMMNPNNMPWMNLGFQGQNKAPNVNNMNMNMVDPFLLGSKLQEAHQTLQREFEINKMLEAKCHEYMSQLEKSAANFEDFKKRIFDQNTNHQEEVSVLQERIQKLTDQLAEKEKQEENYIEELSGLRRKLAIETSSKNRLMGDFEDAQKKLDELTRIKKDREGNMDLKDEELQRMKKQLNSDKEEINYLKGVEERLTLTIKDLNSTNSDLQYKLNELSKGKDDKDQRINMLNIELDSIKNQNQNITQQYRDILSENETLKRELYSLKERSMDAENDLRTMKMTNEKYIKEVNQLKDALRRTEETLEKERRQKAKLISNANFSQDDYQRDYGQDRSSNYDDYSERSREEPKREREVESYQPKYDQYQSKYDNYQSKYEKPTSNLPPKNPDDGYSSKYDRNRNTNPNPPVIEPRGSRNANKPDDRESNYSQNITPKKPTQNNYVEENSNIKSSQPQSEYAGRRRESSQEVSKQDNTKSTSKLSTVNQVYKPTSDLLSWQEPPAIDNRPKTSNNKKVSNTNQDERPGTALQQPNKIAENIAKEKESEERRKEQVKSLEANLLNLQVQRDNLNNELQKMEKNKIKSQAAINRKKEIENDLNYTTLNISNIKNKLRELNALHPF